MKKMNVNNEYKKYDKETKKIRNLWQFWKIETDLEDIK